jgi:hypothetical protein
MLAVWLILAGCAAAPTLPADRPASQPTAQPPQMTLDPEARLRARATQYWDARVRGDLVETYQLHEPAFRRAVTLTAFAQGRGVTTVLEYAVLGQEIQSDLAVVRMKIRSSFRHPKMVKPVEPKWAEFEEQWIRIDGDWYRKFRFPVGDPYPPMNWDEMATRREQSFAPTGR